MKSALCSAKRILVVDDDSVVLDLIAEQLEAHGYSVAVVRGVEVALEALAEGCFLLVLTDIRMAPRGGYAFLRDGGSEIPVLLMSSFSPPDAPEQAEEAGAAGFLRKPFREQQLVDAVSGAFPKTPTVGPAEGFRSLRFR